MIYLREFSAIFFLLYFFVTIIELLQKFFGFEKKSLSLFAWFEMKLRTEHTNR